MKLWIARDKDGTLYLFTEKPIKKVVEWWWDLGGEYLVLDLDTSLYPQVKWTDKEPTEVTLSITSENEPQVTAKEVYDRALHICDWFASDTETGREVAGKIKNLMRQVFSKYFITKDPKEHTRFKTIQDLTFYGGLTYPSGTVIFKVTGEKREKFLKDFCRGWARDEVEKCYTKDKGDIFRVNDHVFWLGKQFYEKY